MGKLSIGLPEIVHLVESNLDAIPYVKSISADGDELHIVMKPPGPLPKAKACIGVEGFVEGKLELQIDAGKALQSILKVLPFGKTGEYHELRIPKVIIDVNKLLQERVKGIRLKDITVSHSVVSIETEESHAGR